jgi:SAM-dependent methyltransferase
MPPPKAPPNPDHQAAMARHPYSRYLTSKRTVDDRALNRRVLEVLRAEMASVRGMLRVLEIGAGLGTMVARLLDWRLIERGEYVLLDVDPRLLADANDWLLQWSRTRGHVASSESDGIRIQGQPSIDLKVKFIQAEIGQFISAAPELAPATLLIANAFLDLVEVPAVLPRLFELLAPDGLYWFSINFDGETILEPGHPDDSRFLHIYHRSMDERLREGRPAGDSKSGRHLFGHLRNAGASILATGASDWVVHAQGPDYPDDEGFFLHEIVETIAAELGRHEEISPTALADWTAQRHQQIDRGELVYIAHQLDFVGRRLERAGKPMALHSTDLRKIVGD